MTQGAETMRIGHIMQEVVWKPASQVHTKSVGGMILKALAIVVLIVFGLTVSYIVMMVDKRVSWKLKAALTISLIICVSAGWYVLS